MRTDVGGRLECGTGLPSAPSAPAEKGAGAAVHVPSMLYCGLLITWIKLLLATQGFKGTLAWIRGRVEKVQVSSHAPLESVRAVEYAVAMAGALYPGRARCLEQSLALYYLLRRQRIAARYCQGVQPYPFQAHAWIEYRGQVINDVPEHAEQFALLPHQLP